MNPVKHTIIGSTLYHIYLSTLKIIEANNYVIDKKQDNLLILFENTKNIESLTDRIENSIFFRKVIILPNRQKQTQLAGKLNYKFFRKKSIISVLEKHYPELKKEDKFIKSSRIYICDTDSSKNYFYYKFKDYNINMIEEGEKTYSHITKKTEILKKKYLRKAFAENGFGDEIKNIHVQHPNRLPKEIKHKGLKLNVGNIVNQTAPHLMDEITSMFEKINLKHSQNLDYSILLTQPMSEDFLVSSEEDKIKIYKDIIKLIPKNQKLIIKTHPRESTNYALHFKDTIILPKLFPIELLQYNYNITFKLGLTLYSTALNNLNNIDKKYYLADKYIKYITQKKEIPTILETCNSYK